MREVQCIICDRKVFIDEATVEAKRLQNNPIRTFMCDDCKSRLDKPKQRPYTQETQRNAADKRCHKQPKKSLKKNKKTAKTKKTD